MVAIWKAWVQRSASAGLLPLLVRTMGFLFAGGAGRKVQEPHKCFLQSAPCRWRGNENNATRGLGGQRYGFCDRPCCCCYFCSWPTSCLVLGFVSLFRLGRPSLAAKSSSVRPHGAASYSGALNILDHCVTPLPFFGSSALLAFFFFVCRNFVHVRSLQSTTTIVRVSRQVPLFAFL